MLAGACTLAHGGHLGAGGRGGGGGHKGALGGAWSFPGECGRVGVEAT